MNCPAWVSASRRGPPSFANAVTKTLTTVAANSHALARHTSCGAARREGPRAGGVERGVEGAGEGIERRGTLPVQELLNPLFSGVHIDNAAYTTNTVLAVGSTPELLTMPNLS